MPHSKRAQTATEYLIITAVVIIIALIVVSVLGGIPGLGGNISEQEIRLKLQIQEIGVTDYVSDSLNTRLWLTNNKQQNVRIEGITVNGKKCSIRSVILRAGQNQLIECWGVKNYDTSQFRFPITITYSDVQTGASFTINDTSVPLVGTGLGGARLHTGQQTCYDCTSNCGVAWSEVWEVSASCDSSHVGQDGYDDGTAKSFGPITDGTIQDLHTGLYWSNASASTGAKATAQIYCDGLNSAGQGGFSDWRVPNVVELVTVLGSSTTITGNPSPNGGFWTAVSSWPGTLYWSSTVDGSGNNFSVRLFSHASSQGYFQINRGNTNSHAVCVRGETSGISLTDTGKNFIDNGDGTVTDSNAGIVWEKELSNTSTLMWQQAIDHCDGLTKAGHSDWRLPTVNEGVNLINYASSSSSNYYPEVFGSPGYDYYWTGTTQPSDADFAYVLALDSGQVYVDGKFVGAFAVLCVRDHD